MSLTFVIWSEEQINSVVTDLRQFSLLTYLREVWYLSYNFRVDTKLIYIYKWRDSVFTFHLQRKVKESINLNYCLIQITALHIISLFSAHGNIILSHMSDMRMTYEYIYEWHTDDIHIRVHTSDIQMIYEYIRMTYVSHTSTYR